jgi:hypothetical protein
MAEAAVTVTGLAKRFSEVVELAGIDFEVPVGTIFGVPVPTGPARLLRCEYSPPSSPAERPTLVTDPIPRAT